MWYAIGVLVLAVVVLFIRLSVVSRRIDVTEADYLGQSARISGDIHDCLRAESKLWGEVATNRSRVDALYKALDLTLVSEPARSVARKKEGPEKEGT